MPVPVLSCTAILPWLVFILCSMMHDSMNSTC
jgi:hypothetical protein